MGSLWRYGSCLRLLYRLAVGLADGAVLCWFPRYSVSGDDILNLFWVDVVTLANLPCVPVHKKTVSILCVKESIRYFSLLISMYRICVTRSYEPARINF